MRKYLCGVNRNDCSGGVTGANNGLNKSVKAHQSREEAFKCMRKHLLGQGYQQIGPREFRKEGQPILLLTKKSRFGGELRTGKNEKTARGARFMPKVRNSGLVY